MPEGHLLHHYARKHDAALRGEPLHVQSPQGKFPEAARLDGQVLLGAEAWGKHLFHRWADGSVVHVHLGQRGLFLHFDPPAPEARPQVRLRVGGTRLVADLIAPTRCELTDAAGVHRIVSRLGPDPLRDDVDPEPFFARAAASRAAIGALLLDQTVIAGVGNVLRAEALFLCGIAPSRPGAALSSEELERVWSTLSELMTRAAEEGRILTQVPPGTDRSRVRQEDTRFVYRQTHCRRCQSPVETPTIGGRTTYLCPTCQAE